VAPVIAHVNFVTLQLSLNVGLATAMLLLQLLPALCTMLTGQVIAGACASTTFTVKVQLDVLPAASVAVAVTVVVPTAKKLPDAGL
jgi:hypothetical protein